MDNKGKNNIIRNLSVIVSVILVCFYPCIYMYVANIGETHFIKIITPFIVFLFFAMVVLFAAYKMCKNMYKTGVITSVFMLFFMNFNVLLDIFCMVLKSLAPKYIMIIIAVIWIVIMVVLSVMKFDYESINLVFTIVFAGLIVFNIISAVPKLISVKSASDFDEVEVKQYAQQVDDKSNVYYIFLDEYGGKENLKYYYDYDNSDFLNNLEQKGFSVSNTTYNYDGILTKEILPNILNLDFVTEAGGIQSNNIKYLDNPVLYRFMKDAGYKINIINHQHIIHDNGENILFTSSDESIYAGTDKDIDGYLMDNSILREVILSINKMSNKSKSGSNKKFRGYSEDLKNAFESLKTCYQRAQDGATFTFCYIQAPHHPFVFDENGEAINDDSKAYEWGDKSYYLNQLKYVNKQIEEATENIIENDPGATIVIQSDHGARYPMFKMSKYKKSEYDAKLETEKMQNPLNCVYMGGKQSEIEGLSSVNTWRKVLNDLYGTNYEYIYPEDKYIYKWRFDMK